MIIERIVGLVPCSLNSEIRKTVLFIYRMGICKRLFLKQATKLALIRLLERYKVHKYILLGKRVIFFL